MSADLPDYTRKVIVDQEIEGSTHLAVDVERVKGDELIDPTIAKALPVSIENANLKDGVVVPWGSELEPLQQDPTHLDLFTQLRHEGVVLDPRLIRALTTDDKIRAYRGVKPYALYGTSGTINNGQTLTLFDQVGEGSVFFFTCRGNHKDLLFRIYVDDMVNPYLYLTFGLFKTDHYMGDYPEKLTVYDDVTPWYDFWVTLPFSYATRLKITVTNTTGGTRNYAWDMKREIWSGA
jgi:hypothetical protein